MRNLAIVLAICAAVFAGCATIDTEEKQYLAARAELNLLLDTYIGMQYEIGDTDHEHIRTAFHTADAALDLWENNLGADWSQNYRAWIEAKSIILQTIKGVTHE